MSSTATLPAVVNDTSRPSAPEQEYPLQPDTETSTYTPSAVEFRQMAKQLPATGGRERDALREEIIRAISSPSLEEPQSTYIQAVLEGFLSSKRPGRLDDAIEILPHAGAEFHRFIMETRTVNPPETTDPDYWYVLIRASGRTPDGRQTDDLIDWALNTGSRPLMEAAILALADRADDRSIARLRELANKCPSPFIRELVEEVLDDCEN